MPVQAHPNFPPVEDDAVLWRYMPYAAYVELLRRSALHLSRVDLLRDPAEGRFAVWDSLMALPEKERAQAASYLAPKREDFAVACWSEHESERTSSWERFAPNYGVAIRTSAKSLRDSLSGTDLNLHLGHVTYTDEPAPKPGERLNLFRWFMRKRVAYADEREVRLMIWGASPRVGSGAGPEPSPVMPAVRDSADLASTPQFPFPVEGFYVPIDLEVLVHEVVVGPPWGRWFTEQVREVTAKLGFPAIPVRRSTLMDAPAPF
ncbi:MAG: hypothetical protein AB7U23_11175 [Dehalococcoidia bacterium]